jgi:DNA topoisomerase-1
VVDDSGDAKDYRSLKKGDDVYTITLDRALELLAEPKKGRRSSSKTATPLRELGQHPEDSEPVNIYDGRYGPYVKHGKINATIPKDLAVENVTLEKAVELIKEKAASKKSKGKSRGRLKSET